MKRRPGIYYADKALKQVDKLEVFIVGHTGMPYR